MTSAVTQGQPPQPPNGAVPDDEAQEAGVREEEYRYRDRSQLQAGSLLTSRSMARRLPSLVRRSVRMAWRVDRGATIGLLVCQIGTGVLAALGLLAVTGTITALISAGDITERLRDAAPQLTVIAAATGLRALRPHYVPPARREPAHHPSYVPARPPHAVVARPHPHHRRRLPPPPPPRARAARRALGRPRPPRGHRQPLHLHRTRHLRRDRCRLARPHPARTPPGQRERPPPWRTPRARRRVPDGHGVAGASRGDRDPAARRGGVARVRERAVRHRRPPRRRPSGQRRTRPPALRLPLPLPPPHRGRSTGRAAGGRGRRRRLADRGQAVLPVPTGEAAQARALHRIRSGTGDRERVRPGLQRPRGVPAPPARPLPRPDLGAGHVVPARRRPRAPGRHPGAHGAARAGRGSRPPPRRLDPVRHRTGPRRRGRGRAHRRLRRPLERRPPANSA